MASAAGFGIKKLSELTYEAYTLWTRSARDYKILTQKSHVKQDGTVVAVTITDEQHAAALRQSLEGPAEKIIAGLAATDMDFPVKVEICMLAK